ncbi:MAG: class I SAM-dependent methyltransferase [Bryobacteraceae bacterium]|nr:class I SAM-dependent methyltransferase [Bryobacteraceae bacterium]
MRRWNERVSLTSITRLEDVVERHYCESVFLCNALPVEPLTLVDVGSGAGFPGFPIAALRSDCHVTLVESNGKKAVFLRECARALGNISVLEVRAERIVSQFDWLVSRAVQWRSVMGVAFGRAARVGLLVGEDAAAEIVHVPGVKWSVPVGLPWGRRRVLILGSVFHVEHISPRGRM